MPTANEVLRDRFLSRQVGIHRLSLHNQRYMQRLLEVALREANRELHTRLLRMQLLGFDSGPLVTRQIEQTISALSALLSESYLQMGDRFGQRMLDLTVAETEVTRAAIRRAVPNAITLEFSFPSESLLRAIVRTNPMQGHAIGSYFARATKPSLVKRILRRYREAIREAVATGLLRSESVDKVTRRVAAQVRGVARWQLRNVVDTATKHVAMESRQAFLASNAGDDGVVKGYQWLSTLDLHTTKEFCIPRDCKTYSVDHEPIGHELSWLAGPGRIHWGCRSTFTAILKSWKALGVKANELEGSMRASMDGQVPKCLHDAAEFFANRKWTEGELVEMFGRRRADRVLSGELSIQGALREVGIRVSGDSLARLSGLNRAEFEAAHLLRQDGESAAVWDKDGNFLGILSGSERSVLIPPEIRAAMDGGVFTHNHPGGRSFSIEDYGIASNHNLAEMRAFGTQEPGRSFLYSLKPGDSGWPTGEGFSQAWVTTAAEIEAQLRRQVLAGTMRATFANQNWVHWVWQRMAKDLGFSYSRTRL